MFASAKPIREATSPGKSREVKHGCEIVLEDEMVEDVAEADLGDGLEWADDPEYPAKYSAYAFKLLMNLIVYATTH